MLLAAQILGDAEVNEKVVLRLSPSPALRAVAVGWVGRRFDVTFAAGGNAPGRHSRLPGLLGFHLCVDCQSAGQCVKNNSISRGNGMPL